MDVVDVTERLMAEFEDRLDLKRITSVVRTCRRDLDDTPTGALPELVERLARQRLLDLISGDAPKAQPDCVMEFALSRPSTRRCCPGWSPASTLHALVLQPGHLGRGHTHGAEPGAGTPSKERPRS